MLAGYGCGGVYRLLLVMRLARDRKMLLRAGCCRMTLMTGMLMVLRWCIVLTSVVDLLAIGVESWRLILLRRILLAEIVVSLR